MKIYPNNSEFVQLIKMLIRVEILKWDSIVRSSVRSRTVDAMIGSISTKVWDRAGIELATPGSAVSFASVARHVGNVSGYRCEADCRSRGREFDPGPVPYFRREPTCLATDAKLTADPGVASSIPARSHTFVEIDHEIISTVILLPSAESFIKGCCQLQAKVCARLLVNCLFKLAQEKSVVR